MSSPDHIAPFKEAEEGIDFKKEKLVGNKRWTYTCMMDGCHNLHKKSYERKGLFNKHLQEHPGIYKRQYTTIEKRGRKENCSTNVANMDDQILRLHQGFDEKLNVLVADFKQIKIKQKYRAVVSTLSKRLTAQKKEIEALEDQKEEKASECHKAKLSYEQAEQLLAQLKREVESRKSEVAELRRDIEALQRDKDVFKEEKKLADVIISKVPLLERELAKWKVLQEQNQSLNDQVAQLKTDCGKAEQARKDAERALKDRDSHSTAFCTNMGFASPAGTSSRVTTPPAKKRKKKMKAIKLAGSLGTGYYCYFVS